MLVGRNFYNNNLCVMLRKGLALTDAHIRTIRRVNISGIYMKGGIQFGRGDNFS